MTNVYTALYLISPASWLHLLPTFSDENHMSDRGVKPHQANTWKTVTKGFPLPFSHFDFLCFYFMVCKRQLCLDRSSGRDFWNQSSIKKNHYYFPVCHNPDWTFFSRNVWNPGFVQKERSLIHWDPHWTWNLNEKVL